MEIVIKDVIPWHSSVSGLHVENSRPGLFIVAVMIFWASTWNCFIWDRLLMMEQQLTRLTGSWGKCFFRWDWTGWHWQPRWWRSGGAWWWQTGWQDSFDWFTVDQVAAGLELDQRAIQRSDQPQLETVLRVSDHLDHIRVRWPFHIGVTDTNQIVAFPHSTNLQIFRLNISKVTIR